ncbi:MAG: YihA family ribosome biogenesis GTP-binding protein [Flavobacteriaceae bacterium]|nr:YihA family ribosome biogenesis GTP-binding protein [Flavobacteriaceae bacterium]|tara:strand:+ start:30631 stop:31236 length:606 start_codon:yes stop_codon:yes gene_type:complete
MNIRSAEFVVSNSDVSKCPNYQFPEYAFIGRSNVGKSSLINCLCNKKKLAKTSSKPGKTQLINHFLINKNWFLVDLPGYGYASVSKKSKSKFQNLISQYFKKRKQLINAYLLIDIRHKIQKIDLIFIEWLIKNYVSFSIVFTKSDKLIKSKIEKNVDEYKKSLLKFSLKSLPPIYITSSNDKTGFDDVLSEIHQLNKNLVK